MPILVTLCLYYLVRWGNRGTDTGQYSQGKREFKACYGPTALGTGYQAGYCACMSLSKILREDQQLPRGHTAFWDSAGVPAAGYLP